jgi:hypothetical protein
MDCVDLLYEAEVQTCRDSVETRLSTIHQDQLLPFVNLLFGPTYTFATTIDRLLAYPGLLVLLISQCSVITTLPATSSSEPARKKQKTAGKKPLGPISQTRTVADLQDQHQLGKEKAKWLFLPDLAGDIVRMILSFTLQESFFFYSDPLMCMMLIKRGQTRYNLLTTTVAQLRKSVYINYESNTSPGKFPVQVLGCWYGMLEMLPNGKVRIRLASVHTVVSNNMIDPTTGNVSIHAANVDLTDPNDITISSDDFSHLLDFSITVAGHVAILLLQSKTANTFEFDVPRDPNVSKIWSAKIGPVIKAMFCSLYVAVQNAPVETFEVGIKVLKDKEYRNLLLKNLKSINENFSGQRTIGDSNQLPWNTFSQSIENGSASSPAVGAKRLPTLGQRIIVDSTQFQWNTSQRSIEDGSAPFPVSTPAVGAERLPSLGFLPFMDQNNQTGGNFFYSGPVSHLDFPETAESDDEAFFDDDSLSMPQSSTAAVNVFFPFS